MENKPTAKSDDLSPPTRQMPSTRRKARQRKQKIMQFIVILAALLIVIVGIVVLVNVFKPQSEKGFWTIDGVTSYRFDGKGNGALVVPTKEYAFTYEKNEDTIFIDYVNEEARDTDFKYVFRGKNLVLISEPDSSGQGKEFVMTRVKE